MIKSRVYILFDQFSAAERRAFKKFVRSPFHNAREDAQLLYEYLLENHRKKALLTKDLLYAHCYSDTKYEDAKFRQVLTHLCRLMEQFLAVNHLVQDEVEMKLLTSKALKDKKLEDLATQQLQKAEVLLEKNDYRNRTHFETHYQILSEKHLIAAGKKRDRQLDMAPLNEALEVSFIIEKLMRSCYMLSHQNLVKTNHSLGLTDAILKYIEEENLLRIPTVKIYYAAYHTLLPEAEEHWFYDMVEQLLEHAALFPKEELSLLYFAPINYAVKKINKGHLNYIKEIFALYKFGLTHEFYIQNGELSRFTYKNIITSSLVLKEFEWTENFLHQYKPFLAEKYRESHFSYNFSKLHFARKEYDEALRLLSLVEYDDLNLNLASKTLLLKIYYETEEWDALDSLLSSFRTFLYRKEVMGYHKTIYQNIIDLTRKMVALGPHNREERAIVRKLVERTEENTEKVWMLEMLGD
ncbi:MAG: hypothetical protein AB8F74_08830 [Saprospiraceae bacterium]